MTDDDTPPLTFHYQTNPRAHTESRPGPTVSEPVSHVPVEPPHDWSDLVRQTRALFRNARHPRADPAWAPLRDLWEEWERWLVRELKMHVDPDDAIGQGESERLYGCEDRLQMCRWFLGRSH